MLKCINCTKVFKQGDSEIIAVKSASVSFSWGINFIVGKSGSGKSTFLHMLAGLEKPSSGLVYWNGIELYASDASTTEIRKKNFGFIFQSNNLVEELSVRDNILLPYYLGATKSKKNFDELTQILGINHLLHKLPQCLSGGEQQRVAIARAMIHDPAVIFADEPTGSLDEANGIIVMELLQRVVNEKKTILIIVSHDLDLLKYSDTTYVMKESSIGEY